MEAALHRWPALGALLVRDGLVSKGELGAVLVRQRISGQQRISGKRLGELLVERGLVTRAQVARLLAEQYELPFVELDGSEVNLQAAMLLSEELARRFSALPIRRLPDDSVLVAVADPTSVLFSDDLRRALGAPLRFAVATPEKVDAAIEFAHQRTQALVERDNAETSSGDEAVRDLPEERGIAPVAEREHEPAFDVERRAVPAWPTLGALLIRDRLVSEEELEAALGQQRVSGSKRLGELLVERGLVTRAQVARLLAEQYELPFVELTESAQERKAAALLPGEIARRYSALPIRVFPDGSLLVAVSDPTSVLYADELRATVGVPLHFAVAAPDTIAAAIAWAYEEMPAKLDDEVAALDAVVVDLSSNQDDDDAGAADEAASGETPDTPFVDELDATRPDVDVVDTLVSDGIVETDVAAEDLADTPPLDVVAEPSADTFVVDELDETAGDEIAAVSETDEVEEAIEHALSLGASDIQFTPQTHAVVVRARIDGVMRELGTIPSSKQAEVATRLKVLGQLDTDEWRAPQEGRVEIRRGEDTVDLRIVVLPTKHEEMVTLHLLR